MAVLADANGSVGGGGEGARRHFHREKKGSFLYLYSCSIREHEKHQTNLQEYQNLETPQ
jgi:hypothetical protein